MDDKLIAWCRRERAVISLELDFLELALMRCQARASEHSPWQDWGPKWIAQIKQSLAALDVILLRYPEESLPI
jgi:hypothetical protein